MDVTEGLMHLCRQFNVARSDLAPIAQAVAMSAAEGLTASEAHACETWRIAPGMFAEAKRVVRLSRAEEDVALRTRMDPAALLQGKIVKLCRAVDAIERARRGS